MLNAAALGLAAFALLGAGLAQGGRWSPRLDMLTHVAPLYVALALLALVLALLARAGRPTYFLALAGLLVSGALVAPEYLRDAGPTAPRQAPDTIKVIQFNAWAGNPHADVATHWILSEQPDIIVLVEGSAIRPRLIAAGYQPACNGCAPAIFAKVRPLRRFPPRRVWNDTSRITYATYADARGEFTVVAVHGHWPNKIAQIQVQEERLRRHMAGWPRARIIMAGDFNSTPWSFTRRRDDRELGLTRRTRALFSWPADRASHNPFVSPLPLLPIDHIYAGEGWATVSVRRGPRIGSDHYPIVAVLAAVGP